MKNGDKPAFAMQAYSDEQFGPIQQEPGLTKREYFAAMAMQSMGNLFGSYDIKEEVVKRSLAFADELLKQLES